MATVRDLLQDKGAQVFTVEDTAMVREALRLMSEKNIGAVLVVNAQGSIEGIFSERDFARRAITADCLPMDTPVRDLMVSPVYFVRKEQTVEECMQVITAKKLRHLPVLEEDRLVGMISIGDVVKHLLAEKDSTIEVLEHFLWVNMI